MRGIVVLGLLAFLSVPADLMGAKPKRKPKDKLEKSIDRALVFLRNHQQADGSWSPGTKVNPAITALAVMAFLSAGHVPGEGSHGKAVEKAVRQVLQAQHDNGLIASIGHHEMYHHGICTLMLAEVAGMTENKELAAEIRRKLVKAVKVILDAQRQSKGSHHGGWRYRRDERIDVKPPADISVTGWQLLALRAAKNLGCDVPEQRIDWAVAFIKRCYDGQSGGFRYQPSGGITVPCTGTSILGLEICGKNFHRSVQSKKAAGYLNRHPPRFGQGGHFFYGVYYCSQAMFQLGGNYWNSYRPKLHKALLDNQQNNGCWPGGDGIGPNYATAMCVLALTVEYRFLPIYQRNEEEEKPKK